MKLYKLGLRVDQKTVVKLPKMYNKTNPTVLAVGYQFIASAANSPFGLLYNNGAISCNVSPLSASKMLSLVGRGCSSDFRGGRGSPSSSVACSQNPWRAHFFSTALAPEVSPVLVPAWHTFLQHLATAALVLLSSQLSQK